MGLFQKYMADNIDKWFKWSKEKGLIRSMTDLVFVHGCTLVTSWAAAAFDDDRTDAQVSLASRRLDNGGAGFVWSNIRGTVEYHDSHLDLDPVCSLIVMFTRHSLTFILFYQKSNPHAPQNRCVFIKCLRASRVFFRLRTVRAYACQSPFAPVVGCLV